MAEIKASAAHKELEMTHQEVERTLPVAQLFLLSLIFVLALMPAASAQVATGDLAGTVKNQSGAAMAGAKVAIANTEAKLRREAVTDANGDYSFTQLPVGKYSVAIDAIGFTNFKLAALALSAGQRARVDASLAAVGGGVCPGGSPRIDLDKFKAFLDELLVKKNPRGAFESLAVSDMVQHASAFGNNRETTIVQWESMTKQPASVFEMESASLDGDIGVVSFKGTLKPGTGSAKVVNYFRFHCGKIIESWDKFEIAK
jgi:predicted SnoaL-like aldol condensation-catalyzing enzyme